MELNDPKKKLRAELRNGTGRPRKKIKNGIKKWNRTTPRKN